MPTSLPEDRIPVIVGVGEIVDRPKDIAAGLEPLTLLGAGAEARGGGQRRKTARRTRLARRRQFPELALPRSRKTACRRGSAPSRRIAITARSAARARSAICTKRRSASRAANAAWRRCAAPRRNRPRPRRSGPASTLPWTPFAHDVEEPKRGAAFQKPMAVKLGVFRPITVYPLYESATSAHWGQTPREALAGIRRSSGRPMRSVASRKSQFLAEEAVHAGRDHDADAGKPADRLALHQADGGQSDRQHGRRDPDDVAGKGPRRRRARGSS